MNEKNAITRYGRVHLFIFCSAHLWLLSMQTLFRRGGCCVDVDAVVVVVVLMIIIFCSSHFLGRPVSCFLFSLWRFCVSRTQCLDKLWMAACDQRTTHRYRVVFREHSRDQPQPDNQYLFFERKSLRLKGRAIYAWMAAINFEWMKGCTNKINEKNCGEENNGRNELLTKLTNLSIRGWRKY